MYSIGLTILLAIFLTATYQSIALAVDPFWLMLLPNDWVILVVFFWAMVRPDGMSFVFLWFLGLLLDVLYQHPLGVNGLFLASLAYVGQQIYVAYESDTKKMLSLLLGMFAVIVIAKTSLLSVLLNTQFSFSQFFETVVAIAYATAAIPIRKLAMNSKQRV